MADLIISEAVDKYIQTENPERLQDGKWHPSSLSSPCHRRAVLEKRKVPFSMPPDDATKRIFMLGKIIHRLVQDAVAQDPKIMMVIPELLVVDEENEVTGQLDILIYRLDTAKWELIEIKSIKAMGVRYGIPKPEHVIQAGIYADVLMRLGGTTEQGDVIPPLGHRLGTVRFVYVEKEGMVIHERTVDAEDAVARATARLSLLQDMEKRAYLPMVDKGSWFRNYCPYRGSGECCADG